MPKRIYKKVDVSPAILKKITKSDISSWWKIFIEILGLPCLRNENSLFPQFQQISRNFEISRIFHEYSILPILKKFWHFDKILICFLINYINCHTHFRDTLLNLGRGMRTTNIDPLTTSTVNLYYFFLLTYLRCIA